MNVPNSDLALHSKDEEKLAVSLTRLWKSAHGSSVGNVHVFLQPDSITAWIDSVLSPAEQTVARSKDGYHLIERYTEELLSSIQSELGAEVETIVGRRITAGNASIDLESNRMFCFFVLGQPLTRGASCLNK